MNTIEPRFEQLDVTLRAALGAQPYLEQWLDQVEFEDQEPTEGAQILSTSTCDGAVTDLLDLRDRAAGEGDFSPQKSLLPLRRTRKSRAVFDDTAVEHMTHHFKRNPKPRGEELTRLAESIGHQRESVRIWFSNRRYQLGLASKR
ncbi:unnamed protein product [Mesocestoides corti]|uniref:Homeobox domain-containing protein n=1 Tax=Mesocestoides corti TaxID=53468 RepID=A0A0R3UMU2_MESCO|nr:unnamed protein product [Mesocestoides corti]